ncbi:rna-directed dna polymerase from mobile element jockey-like [Limosa lapponica baueri]|uniref:Rna-directed dna polymerase from mobile element jockey-like n=1 Tax=Limosa lapponica baueri TaxID=1758121 RepID=A0A2I0UL24_LIMLA|nr:rna-directed dna polymerase from mobile element jockey-like [Limosa lapponica baueri]
MAEDSKKVGGKEAEEKSKTQGTTGPSVSPSNRDNLINLVASYNGIRALVDNGRVTDVIYLDLCKAFDTVPHDILASKLERHGFDGWITRRIRNWLDGHIQRLVVNSLTSKWQPVMSGVPHGLVLGPVLLNIFVDNMDSVIACTVSKFADDTKLCGAVDMLKGRGAIQRDLVRLDRWAHKNFMKFSQAKCKVLHMGWGNPKHKYQLGGEWIESSPEEKDLAVLVDKKLNMRWQCGLRKPTNPGLHQKKHGQQVEAGDSVPLFHSRETPPEILHPALGPSTKGHGPVGASPEEGQKHEQRAGAPLL